MPGRRSIECCCHIAVSHITSFTHLLGRLNETNKQDYVIRDPYKKKKTKDRRSLRERSERYLGRRRALLGLPHAALVADITWFCILSQIRPHDHVSLM